MNSINIRCFDLYLMNSGVVSWC